jgi:hypothetical protein
MAWDLTRLGCSLHLEVSSTRADDPSTQKTFKVDLATVAHWRNGAIIEGNLFYDGAAGLLHS